MLSEWFTEAAMIERRAAEDRFVREFRDRLVAIMVVQMVILAVIVVFVTWEAAR